MIPENEWLLQLKVDAVEHEKDILKKIINAQERLIDLYKKRLAKQADSAS